MNKLCKVKPLNCHICVAADKNYDMDYDCEKCEKNKAVYELISVGHSDSIGDWAMVMKDGVIRRVALSRVWDVKEKPTLYEIPELPFMPLPTKERWWEHGPICDSGNDE